MNHATHQLINQSAWESDEFLILRLLLLADHAEMPYRPSRSDVVDRLVTEPQ